MNRILKKALRRDVVVFVHRHDMEVGVWHIESSDNESNSFGSELGFDRFGNAFGQSPGAMLSTRIGVSMAGGSEEHRMVTRLSA